MGLLGFELFGCNLLSFERGLGRYFDLFALVESNIAVQARRLTFLFLLFAVVPHWPLGQLLTSGGFELVLVLLGLLLPLGTILVTHVLTRVGGLALLEPTLDFISWKG